MKSLEFSRLVLPQVSTIEPHPLLAEYVSYPPKNKLGMDEIFLINLQRRPERRIRMEWAFRELGIDFKLFDAVDGR